MKDTPRLVGTSSHAITPLNKNKNSFTKSRTRTAQGGVLASATDHFSVFCLRRLAEASPPAFSVLGVVLFHLGLALLDRRVKQEYERRERERAYDVGRGVPELRR